MTGALYILVTLVCLLFVALVALFVEARNAARWRLTMVRLYAVPSAVDHACFDAAFVRAVADDIAGRIDASVDAALARRLPSAEQFEATVRALVTAREAKRSNGGAVVENGA